MDWHKELIFAPREAKDVTFLRKLQQKGRVKKIAPKVYTTNLMDSPEEILRRNLLELLSWRFPGCVVSHRSAQSMHPTEHGNVYVTYSFTKRIVAYPGLILNVMNGPKPVSDDIRIGSLNVYISSEYRWILEVLQPSRADKNGESKGMTQADVEHRMEDMLNRGGEDALNRFRDKTRQVAAELQMADEFDRLNTIISALLATHDSNVLTSEFGKARALGNPVDRNRVRLFETLHEHLSNMYFPSVAEPYHNETEYQLFAFFESYFSNYIEGTRFEVSEAKQIVETGVSIPMRREDSHDILATYKLLANRQEMNIVPKTENEFIEILRYRHRIMLEGRGNCLPGMFKQRQNQAGDTVFVAPDLVEGTLRYGFRYYLTLPSPMAKAIYMMFLCSEVHPFTDGNGRISRMMMNAELNAAGQSHIIVPTVFREDYLLALRKLSRNGLPDTYVGVMERLHRFSSSITCSDFESARLFLERTNAFSDAENAHLLF